MNEEAIKTVIKLLREATEEVMPPAEAKSKVETAAEILNRVVKKEK